MVAHAVQWAGAVHQDLVEKRILRSSTKDALFHKGAAIRLLSERLANLALHRKNLSSLSNTVAILASHELNEDVMEGLMSAKPLAFEPLLLPSKELRVYAELDWVPEHVRAMQLLFDCEYSLPDDILARACRACSGQDPGDACTSERRRPYLVKNR